MLKAMEARSQRQSEQMEARAKIRAEIEATRIEQQNAALIEEYAYKPVAESEIDENLDLDQFVEGDDDVREGVVKEDLKVLLKGKRVSEIQRAVEKIMGEPVAISGSHAKYVSPVNGQRMTIPNHSERNQNPRVRHYLLKDFERLEVMGLIAEALG